LWRVNDERITHSGESDDLFSQAMASAKFDGSTNRPSERWPSFFVVSPAQAGIQGPEIVLVALDARFRGHDEMKNCSTGLNAIACGGGLAAERDKMPGIETYTQDLIY
jgi:hypothetical protein